MQEFNKGIREGRGKHRFEDGRVYEGMWFKDNMEGEGECHFPNGHTYNG